MREVILPRNSNTVIENNYLLKGPLYLGKHSISLQQQIRLCLKMKTKRLSPILIEISSSGDYLVDTYQQR